MIDRENERIHERGKKKTEEKRNVCRINEGKIKRESKEGVKVKKAARQRKRNVEKDREMREENERVERVKGRWWKCGSVSRNRCREGFRRRQYFNRRQIYRPPGRPTIRNGRCARYVPLREVISCLSRPPGLSV